MKSSFTNEFKTVKMRRFHTVWIAVFALVTANCQSQTKTDSMEEEIKSLINSFVKAGEKHNVAVYDDILHEKFRVIANRYPTPDKTTVIPAAGYVALIAKKTIGGKSYNVIFKTIEITNHSATALVNLKADNGGQWVTFLLIQNQENQWQIITNIAVQY